MANALLSLGSNLGDRSAALMDAVGFIRTRVGRVVSSSEAMHTAAVGYQTHNHYLNEVVEVQTELQPLELLDVLQQIEQDMGRTQIRTCRSEPISDRIIDLDILRYWDDMGSEVVMQTPRLTLPHPELGNREFLRVLCQRIGHHLNK